MERENGRIVRLLSCDLTAPEDITDDLLNHTLAWIWMCDNLKNGIVQEGPCKVTPSQGMYDFGLDEDVPNDWLVWPEHSDRSVSIAHDLRVLHRYGVRGNFIIMVVGTLVIERWRLTDDFILGHTHRVVFREDPDLMIPTVE